MRHLGKYFLLFLFLISICFIAGYPEQDDFSYIFLGFTAAFGAFVFLISKQKTWNISFVSLVALGLIARLCLVPLFPNLSDDIYRFFWDGMLMHHGINPYAFLPGEVLSHVDSAQMQLAYNEMNSPDYYTIYPPVAQFIFYLGSFAKTLTGFSIVLKLLFVGLELLCLYSLVRLSQLLNFARENVFYYFLNPLVIIEGVGNLHFEVVMLSCFAACLYFLARSKLSSFVFAYVLSIASKLVPLIFGPILFLKYLSGKKGIISIVKGFIVSLIIFAPVYLGLQYSNFGESLDLYFRKFEFNASLYFLFRKLGFLITGYNTIQTLGPILGLSALLGIVWISFKPREEGLKPILYACIAIVTIYLLTATTVHPWYLMTLILLSVFRPYKYILVWSYLILLSYHTYSHPEFQENMLFVSIEYLVVFLLIAYELILQRKHPEQTTLSHLEN